MGMYKGPIVKKPGSPMTGALAGLGAGVSELAKYQMQIELEQKKMEMEIQQLKKKYQAVEEIAGEDAAKADVLGLKSKSERPGRKRAPKITPVKGKDNRNNDIILGYKVQYDDLGITVEMDKDKNIKSVLTSDGKLLQDADALKFLQEKEMMPSATEDDDPGSSPPKAPSTIKTAVTNAWSAAGLIDPEVKLAALQEFKQRLEGVTDPVQAKLLLTAYKDIEGTEQLFYEKFPDEKPIGQKITGAIGGVLDRYVDWNKTLRNPADGKLPFGTINTPFGVMPLPDQEYWKKKLAEEEQR